MSSHPTVAFISENEHTDEIAAHIAKEGYNVERLNLTEFHNLNKDKHGRDVLKEAVFFVPLEDKNALSALEELREDTKVPAVGYVSTHHAHQVQVPSGVALLKHEGDVVTFQETFDALEKAKELASSSKAAAAVKDGSWLSL